MPARKAAVDLTSPDSESNNLDSSAESHNNSKNNSKNNRAHIMRLSLRDFRNHQAVAIDSDARVVGIIGENGVGKTNMLEAVSMLSGGLGAGRGLRGAAFSDLIRNTQNTQAQEDDIYGWSVQADIIADNIPSRIGINYRKNNKAPDNNKAHDSKESGGRRLTLDGAPVKGLEILNELTPQLWLTPAMDRLFMDGASGRRKFLDRFAQSLSAASAKHWGQYERAMRERNRLLQDYQSPPYTNAQDKESWLTALEDMMAAQGVAIAVARLHAFDVLAAGLLSFPYTGTDKGTDKDAAFPSADIALEGDLEAQIRARPAIEVEDEFRATLRAMRGRDGAAGRALSGPHRSDLIVHLEGKNMPAAKASTGEQKGLLLGLLLAQAYAILRETGKAPLLLLDEVTAHLDAARRQALAALLADLGAQIWMTGTDAAIFNDMFSQSRDITQIELPA